MLTPTSITIIKAYKIARSMPRKRSPVPLPLGWSPRPRWSADHSIPLPPFPVVRRARRQTDSRQATSRSLTEERPARDAWSVGIRLSPRAVRDALPRWSGPGRPPRTPSLSIPPPRRDLWRRKNIFIATVPLMMLCDKIDARRIMLLLILMLLLVGGSPDLIMGLI